MLTCFICSFQGTYWTITIQHPVSDRPGAEVFMSQKYGLDGPSWT